MGADSSLAYKGYFGRYFDERTASNLEAYREVPRSLLSHCYQRRLAICLDWLRDSGLPPGSMILDVGCGASPLVQEVGRLGYRGVGVDYSFAMLREAQAGFPPKFAQGDIEALPIPARTFDAVFCLGVICYLPSDDAALRELSRVTRAGGLLMLSVPNKMNLTAITDPALYVQKKLRTLLRRRGGGPGSRAGPEYTERYYTISQVNDLLERAGFVPETFRTLGFGPITMLGRPLVSQQAAICISRAFEGLHWVSGLRTLGTRYLVRARKRP
ncbi:MAG: class I SAM-dependent methyltransferase [Actinomycetota bacterium]